MSSTTAQPSIGDADDAIQQRQKRAALAVAMLGFAVVALDAQITNVALPAIRQHLGGGLPGLPALRAGRPGSSCRSCRILGPGTPTTSNVTRASRSRPCISTR